MKTQNARTKMTKITSLDSCLATNNPESLITQITNEYTNSNIDKTQYLYYIKKASHQLSTEASTTKQWLSSTQQNKNITVFIDVSEKNDTQYLTSSEYTTIVEHFKKTTYSYTNDHMIMTYLKDERFIDYLSTENRDSYIIQYIITQHQCHKLSDINLIQQIINTYYSNQITALIEQESFTLNAKISDTALMDYMMNAIDLSDIDLFTLAPVILSYAGKNYIKEYLNIYKKSDELKLIIHNIRPDFNKNEN